MLIPHLQRAGQGGPEPASTAESLQSQWVNPSDVSTLLMVIGGEIVRTALAQGTGKWYFTPVCFSFGWVSYAFTALVNVIGDGRLLPPPDHPVKVFNLDSGYVRDNKNWVIGRILRDLESSVANEYAHSEHALRITVFDALPNPNGPVELPLSKIHVFSLGAMILQLGLSAIPIALDREWDILLITAVGTLLAQISGSIPQWRAEKLPNRQRRSAVYALTQGNGSREVMVIRGQGNCLDLEELSSAQSPRASRPWEKFHVYDIFSHPRTGPDGRPMNVRADTALRRSRDIYGYPVGFWITSAITVLQSVLWLLLLVNVAASRSYSWVLVAVGTIGMFQNGLVAAIPRKSASRNLPLQLVETITTSKVMDAIMDFEVRFGKGDALRREFFPGDLRPEEISWWKGDREPYNKLRASKGRSLPATEPFEAKIKSKA